MQSGFPHQLDLERTKGPAKKAAEGPGLFRVREKGTEDLVFWEEHCARGLCLVHACSTSRRVDRLRVGTTSERKQNCSQGDRSAKAMPIRHIGTTGEWSAFYMVLFALHEPIFRHIIPDRAVPATSLFQVCPEVATVKASLIVLVVVTLCAPVAAQWLNQPTAGIPRAPDGKPNLSAPAPRTPDGKPDLSGLWTKISPKYSRNIAADLKPEDVQPWARALLEERRENLGKDYMNVKCVPLGPGYATAADSTGAEMMKIVQTPGLILILNPDLTYRQIFLDGRALEAEPNPTWMGYSVGRWEETRSSWRASASTIERGSTMMAIHTPRRCAPLNAIVVPMLAVSRSR